MGPTAACDPEPTLWTPVLEAAFLPDLTVAPSAQDSRRPLWAWDLILAPEEFPHPSSWTGDFGMLEHLREHQYAVHSL